MLIMRLLHNRGGGYSTGGAVMLSRRRVCYVRAHLTEDNPYHVASALPKAGL